MAKRSKRYQKLLQRYDKIKLYSLDEAIKIVKEIATASYNETVDLTLNLNVDPKKANENIRGSLVLPAGTGKDVKVLVFASGEKAKEAEEAGADFVGLEELAEKIQKGWLDFDAVIATPDTMKVIGSLGRVLGPRGMMPNPKLGTLTNDIADAVKKMKSGQIEYRTDKFGIMRLVAGKSGFEQDKLKENIAYILRTVIKSKPAHIGARTMFIKTAALSTTHSPSVKLDINKFWAELV